eukprot:8003684-Pyramimonas_sp.AAC.2
MIRWLQSEHNLGNNRQVRARLRQAKRDSNEERSSVALLLVDLLTSQVKHLVAAVRAPNLVGAAECVNTDYHRCVVMSKVLQSTPL